MIDVDYNEYKKTIEENMSLITENHKLKEETERLNNIILTLENERDILKSKLSDIKADIHYLLKNGESVYIRNKYIRGDKE